MKKHIFILIIATVCSFADKIAAQNVIVEDFGDKVHFDWMEYADKTGSAMIKENGLELVCNDDDLCKLVRTELPLRIEEDFKISTTIFCPVINDKNYFGIFIDNDENLNKCMFLLKEAQFKCCIYNNKPTEFTESLPVKLKGGKNRTVDIVLQRKGGKYIFSVNNMEIYKWARPIKSSDFGFYTEGKSSVKITEIKVEQ